MTSFTECVVLRLMCPGHFGISGLARALAVAGYAVYGMDYPGFGLSEGLHGYISNFDTLVDDVIEQYRAIKGKSYSHCFTLPYCSLRRKIFHFSQQVMVSKGNEGFECFAPDEDAVLFQLTVVFASVEFRTLSRLALCYFKGGFYLCRTS